MNRLEYLSCNNLKYSDDVSSTKKTVKSTKRQNEYLFTPRKHKKLTHLGI